MSVPNKIFTPKLIWVCNFFLVLPPSSEYGKNVKYFRVCAGIYILFTTVAFAWVILFSDYFDENLNDVLQFLHKINSTGLFISSVAMIFKITFRITGTYQQFLKNMLRMNEVLDMPWRESNNLFYTLFVYFLCLFLSFLKTYYDIFKQNGSFLNISLILDMFECIQGSFYLAVSISLVQCLKFQYASIINKLLLNDEKYIYSAPKQNVSYIKSEVQTKDLEEVIRLHEQICDLVDAFNEIFGSVFVPVVFNTAMSILLYSTSLATLFLNNVQGDLEGSIQTFISIALSVVLIIALAHECSCVVAKGNLLVATCFSFSNRMSLKQRLYETEQFERYLSILSHQAETRIPQFSAGGFFTIDYSMLTMIAGSLTTNMVIVLQFMQSNKKTC